MNTRRKFLISSLLAGIGMSIPLITSGRTEADNSWPGIRTRIAFGSCCKSWLAQDIWQIIAQANPELFLFLGDVVYTDQKAEEKSGTVEPLSEAYRDFSATKEFRDFREQIPVLATWDDHDYGLREGGSEFSLKDSSRNLFLDFWQVPNSDPRRNQVGGIYTSYEYGPLDRRIQIILLDTRFSRSPLLSIAEEEFERVRAGGFGPYRPNMDPDARMLHEVQWTWLEKQLRRPAQLRLMCSSIPFAAGFRGWESWANFPLERMRFIRLIEKTGASGVIFLSGDIHYGDLSCETHDVPYPIWDLTSSGLTHYWPTPGPNVNRVYLRTVHERNFGLVHVRWDLDDPLAILEIRDASGKIMVQHALRLNALQVSANPA